MYMHVWCIATHLVPCKDDIAYANNLIISSKCTQINRLLVENAYFFGISAHKSENRSLNRNLGHSLGLKVRTTLKD